MLVSHFDMFVVDRDYLHAKRAEQTGLTVQRQWIMATKETPMAISLMWSQRLDRCRCAATCQCLAYNHD